MCADFHILKRVDVTKGFQESDGETVVFKLILYAASGVSVGSFPAFSKCRNGIL